MAFLAPTGAVERDSERERPKSWLSPSAIIKLRRVGWSDRRVCGKVAWSDRRERAVAAREKMGWQQRAECRFF